jgi:hypothetical protein
VTSTRVSPAAQLTGSTRVMVRLGDPGALAGTVAATRVQVGPWGRHTEQGKGARRHGEDKGAVQGLEQSALGGRCVACQLPVHPTPCKIHSTGEMCR